MRVLKVLNNSLVLALDDNGQEIILMGKGIGYHKSIGYEFHEDEIDKVFVLKEKEVSRRIVRLAAETDEIYFETAKKIIDYAIETYQMDLMEHIYLSLTDHLAFVAKRIHDGIVIQNFYTLDMREFNPKEFDIGEYAIHLLERKLHVKIPIDEAGNIAFHFINAQINHPFNEKNIIITHTLNDILDIVKYNYGITYEEDSIAYVRYVSHLRLFIQRLVSKQLLQEEGSALLYDQIAAVCTSEFKCVKKIEIYANERFGIPFTDQEKMYLALHIHRIIGGKK